MFTDQSPFQWNPTVLVGKALAVALFAVAFGVLLPLVVAWRGGMMTDKDVSARVGHHVARLEGRAGPVAAAERRKYGYLARHYVDYLRAEGARKQKEDEVARIDAQLRTVPATPIDRAAVAALIDLRAHLRKEIEDAKSPAVFSGYLEQDTMLLWPSLYFFLGCLVYIVPPPGGALRRAGMSARDARALLGSCLLAYLGMHSPTLARNFVFYDEGRRVFAQANLDVFPAGFLTQEFQFFLFASLVVVVTRQWMTFYSLRRRELSDEEARNAPPADLTLAPFEPKALERLSVTYLHWQAASLLLALAFILDTKNFWDAILINKDLRYIPSAVIIHIVWVTVWIVMSLPVFLTWYTHKVVRDRAVCALAVRPAFEKDRAEFTLKALKDLQPIGTRNLVVTGVATLFSFLAPAVQALLK